jgi:nucleotide-binding universal stress UspA family protein
MSTVSIKMAPTNFRVAPRASGLAINNPHASNVSKKTARVERARSASARNEPAFREVLVPVDGSSYAEHALPWAIQWATLAGAPLRLVYVHVQMQPFFHGRRERLYVKYDRFLREPMEEYLADLSLRISRASSIEVKSSMVDGHGVADVLADLVGVAANPVVMGTRGRTAISRMLVGGAADAILRGASGPVLHVRGYQCPVDLTARPSLRHALAAFDDNAQSASMLESVSQLVKLFDGQLTVLRVLESPSLLAFANAHAGNVFNEVRKLDERHLEELESLASSPSTQLLSMRTSLVWSDTTPRREILSQAHELEADYISIATRNRSRLRRFVRPGVYDYLIRHSRIPVLVVKQSSNESD